MLESNSTDTDTNQLSLQHIIKHLQADMETALTLYVLAIATFYFAKKFKPDDDELYELRLVFWGVFGLFITFAVFTILI